MISYEKKILLAEFSWKSSKIFRMSCFNQKQPPEVKKAFRPATLGSTVTEKARTELAISFNYVLRKQKELKRKKRAYFLSRCVTFLHIQRHKNGLCFISLSRCISFFC